MEIHSVLGGGGGGGNWPRIDWLPMIINSPSSAIAPAARIRCSSSIQFAPKHYLFIIWNYWKVHIGAFPVIVLIMIYFSSSELYQGRPGTSIDVTWVYDIGIGKLNHWR